MSALEAAWSRLLLPESGSLSAKPHPAVDVLYLGLDDQGRRHLLVRLPEGTKDQSLLRTRGLTASVTRLQIEGEPLGPWADLSCLDPSLNDTFASVADDLADEVGKRRSNPLPAVTTTLETWRRFWGAERRTLTESEELGLFGELWFIDQWLAPSKGVESWVGPNGNRHDFVTEGTSVEVKATRSSDGGGRHHITSLDQLEAPTSGVLYLFSLQLAQDAGAGNTLRSLVERLRVRLADRPDLVMRLEECLGRIGWVAARQDEAGQPFRIISQGLYRVDGDFPRLTNSDLVPGPRPGVVAINYSVEIAACHPWLVASVPAAAAELLSDLR